MTNLDVGNPTLQNGTDGLDDAWSWHEQRPAAVADSESQVHQLDKSHGVRQKKQGLNIFTTSVFIIGVIAGTGFLTMPRAVEDSSWIGFVLMLIFCVVSAYTGTLLGKCWMILLAEKPELIERKVGDPYPTIAEAAYGKPARYLVSFSIFCTMFGGTIVYLLLAAENIRELIPAGHGMNLCYITLIIGGAMTPLTWLGSPKDFWGIAAAASIVTGTASIILFTDVLVTAKTNDVIHTKVDVVSFFTSYGTLVFGFNGHAAFPTFQADMREPSKFGKAIGIGYVSVLFMYVPSAAAGYALFGQNVSPNIIVNMESGIPKTIVSILMTSHLLFGIIIILNPVTQEIEGILKIPTYFTWKRLVSRTCMMAAVLFVAESVPHFSSILSLVGGSTISILAIICPPLFFMKLTKSTTIQHMAKPVPLHMKVFHMEIIFIGIVAGIAATYSAITDLATNKFTVPCYIDPVRASQ